MVFVALLVAFGAGLGIGADHGAPLVEAGKKSYEARVARGEFPEELAKRQAQAQEKAP